MARRKQKTPNHRMRPEIRERFEKLLKKPKQGSSNDQYENKLTPKIGLLRWPSMEEVEL